MPHLFCLVDASVDRSLLPELARAGVPGFQVRAKALTDAELLAFTQAVIADVRPYGASVIVNDRVDVALAAGADGVHLGRTDLPIQVARRLAPGLLVGATCRNRSQAEAAAAAGADYAGFGPVFATRSKTGLPAPLGLEAVTSAAGPLPLLAIGGMEAGTARAAREAGAHGVAVIGAIWRQPDPVTAAKELLEAIA
ncbi:thiamine phosphate synthase [Nocardioides pocheonensis]|uniref:thiamine phosphate synthase n=1 Tax=Nocardioides pocheonensis TaxID=661485 RepID=UPI00161E757D|nr:thiamine phosphate synthase [Nocardioides pocheonensis]